MGTDSKKERTVDGYRITKVKSKDDKIFIHAEHEKNGSTLERSIHSDQEARPEFYKALAKLGKNLVEKEFEELPEAWLEDHRIYSISLSYDSDEWNRMWMKANIQFPQSKYKEGFNFNTPSLREEVSGAPGGGPFMKEQTLDLVNAVIKEAHAYLDGERAQEKLIKDKKAAAETGVISH